MRLLRLSHVGRFIQRLFNVDFFDPGYIKLLNFVLGMCIVSHIVACGWIMLGSFDLSDTVSTYTEALYWSITTLSTVGYGDRVPVTHNQMYYTNGYHVFRCRIIRLYHLVTLLH